MAGDGADVTSPTLDLDDFMGIELHHRPGRQALPAARPAVRQPLLVPQGLVRQPRLPGALQGEVRLRPRRAGQLVGLRGHRRVLHQRREGDRRRPHLRPHGLRQARARPRLAHDRRLAVDGGRRHRRASRTASRSTSGASAWRRAPATRSAPASAAAARRTARRRSTPSPSGTSGCASTRLPSAASYDFYQSLPALSQGNVAQQIFWYTAFVADMVKPKSEGNNTVDDEGNLLWRMAPSPHGPYWQEGQKVGYQDVGSWTILKSTPLDRAKAAWLYAQFVTSKTVDTKKSHVGLTFIRDSHRPATRASPSARRSSAAWSSSTARPTGCAGRRPASTCRTTRSSRRSGGSRSAT